MFRFYSFLIHIVMSLFSLCVYFSLPLFFITFFRIVFKVYQQKTKSFFSVVAITPKGMTPALLLSFSYRFSFYGRGGGEGV